MRLKEVFSAIFDILYPPKCVGCGKVLPDTGIYLCDECSHIYELESKLRCYKCGYTHIYCQCGIFCRDEEHTALHCVGYDNKRKSIARNIILGAKESNYKSYYEFMSGEIVRMLKLRFESNFFEVFPKENTALTYVTRRKSALRRKGHDQARELAKRVASALEFPLCELFCNEGKKAQKTLGKAERMINAKKSYSFCGKREDIEGKTVIIIDDIITTGAGMSVCGNLLYENGVSKAVMVSYGRNAPDEKRKKPLEEL